MKILVIPDIHGEEDLIPTQEEIDEVDLTVFLGDYLDSFYVEGAKQLELLIKVIELKKDNPTKIILLLGNHDIQYIYNKYYCSGYLKEYALAFGSLLRDNRDLFQNSFLYGKHLFTHAGVDFRLLKALNAKYPTYVEDGFSLEYMLNNSNIRELFYIGKDCGGVDPFGGIFWIRPWTIELPLQYIQHVGHTVNVHSNYFNNLINYYDGGGKVRIEIEEGL